METGKVLKLDSAYRGEKGQVRFDPLWDRTSDGVTNAPQGRFVVHFIPEDIVGDGMALIKEQKGVVRLIGRFDSRSQSEWQDLGQWAEMVKEYDLHEGD